MSLRHRVVGSFLIVTWTLSNSLHAGSRERAFRLHNRLTCIPPKAIDLDKMTRLLDEDKSFEAAKIALNKNEFYDCSLKQWCTPWSNQDRNPFSPLNDMCATVIGLVRDDEPIGLALYEDVIYTAKDEIVADQALAVPPYSLENNQHYERLEVSGLSLKDSLAKRIQSEVTGIKGSAGIFTTRAFGGAFYNMGTNRRALRFTMLNFMCRDLEQVMDTTRPDYRVRRDVSRAPGGDSNTFNNRCKGCHAGMDALAGAFAYYDFKDNRVVHTPGQVQRKYNQNTTEFPDGFVTKDDEWLNLWSEGQNASFGWNPTVEGHGIAEFGKMVAESKGFGQCIVQRVFSHVCLRDGSSTADKALLEQLVEHFREDHSNVKNIFALTAIRCLGD